MANTELEYTLTKKKLCCSVNVSPRSRLEWSAGNTAMTAVPTHVSQRGAHCSEAALRDNIVPHFILAICSLFMRVMHAKMSFILVLPDFNTLQKKHKTSGSFQNLEEARGSADETTPVLISIRTSKIFQLFPQFFNRLRAFMYTQSIEILAGKPPRQSNNQTINNLSSALRIQRLGNFENHRT